MKDPLLNGGPEQELFLQIGQLVNKQPAQLVVGVAINLLVNAIRQSVPVRSSAESYLDEACARAKTTLLDKHYDPVTGFRRTVFPFTQVLQASFHADSDKFGRPT